MSMRAKKRAHYLLESVQILDARVRRWADEYERCKGLVERFGVQTLDLPVVQSSPRSSGAEWDAYIKAKEAYGRAIDAYLETKGKVLNVLDEMTNLTQVRVLELRYLDDDVLSFERIGRKLGLSKSRIQALHEDALAEFAKVYNCRTKQDKTGQNRTK